MKKMIFGINFYIIIRFVCIDNIELIDILSIFIVKKAKLAIEIDGEGHYTEKQINHDRARTQVLNKSNIEVIRFSNIEVNKKFKAVCRAIDLKVRNKLHIKDD